MNNNLKTVLSTMPFTKMQTPTHFKEVLQMYSRMVEAGTITIDFGDFIGILTDFFENWLHDHQLSVMVQDFGAFCAKQPIKSDSMLFWSQEQLEQEKKESESKAQEQEKKASKPDYVAPKDKPKRGRPPKEFSPTKKVGGYADQTIKS